MRTYYFSILITLTQRTLAQVAEHDMTPTVVHVVQYYVVYVYDDPPACVGVSPSMWQIYVV